MAQQEPSGVFFFVQTVSILLTSVEHLAAQNPELCEKDISLDNGTFHSPNYPGLYPLHANCSWRITVSEGYQVKLQFPSFEITDCENCECDSVVVFDGHDAKSPILGKFCGKKDPGVIRSTQNKIFINFVANGEAGMPGFFANFTKDICEEDIHADNGTLSSRNYPLQYEPFERCVWKITVSSGHAVVLRFQSFELEDCRDCTCDAVVIFDGHESSNKVLGKFCGERDPGTIFSSKNKMSVSFITNGARQEKGFLAIFTKVATESTLDGEPSSVRWNVFKIYYSTADSGVKEELKNWQDLQWTDKELDVFEKHLASDRGTFHTPKYPEPYPSFVECTWKITAPAGSRIYLEFLSFELYDSADCKYDSVSVFNGQRIYPPILPSEKEALWRKFCGNTTPGAFLSSENEITVKFVSGVAFQNLGFSAFYRKVTECIKPEFALNSHWWLHNGFCYMIYLPIHFTWDNARAFCQYNGAFLTSMHSPDEQQFLLDLYPRTSHSQSFWIGMKVQGTDSADVWVDRTPVDFGSFEDDDVYVHPNTLSLCVSMHVSTGRWQKEDCNLRKHAFCKVKKNLILPGYCLDKWEAFESKCFSMRPYELPWLSASEDCANLGGTLASIHSKEEQEFLDNHRSSLYGREIWIGLYRYPDGEFRWTDNSPLEYRNWQTGEPNSLAGEEKCVHMLAQVRWNDNSCDVKMSYICQAPKEMFCTEDACKNGGICMQTEPYSPFRCVCTLWYTGPRCQQTIPCNDDICKNGGTCTYGGTNGGFKCYCNDGYAGLTCQDSTDATISQKINLPAAIGIPLGLTAVVVLFILLRKLKKLRMKKRLHDSEADESDLGLSDPNDEENQPYDEKWEFPKTRLKFIKTLGKGEFGKVVKAYAIGIEKNSVSTVVAVKMTKDKSNESQRNALLTELKMLMFLGQHVNIVNLLGAVTKNSKRLMIIVEYCRFGSLRQYLLHNRTKFVTPSGERPKKEKRTKQYRRRHLSLPDSSSSSTSLENPETPTKRKISRKKTTDKEPKPGGFSSESSGTDSSEVFRRTEGKDRLTIADLTCFSYQCASGMEYIASRRLIHRDLAARNTLLADRNVVKICDFGLTKDLYQYPNYVKKSNNLVPLKWMAIESIGDRVYSTKSDVWSFGVLLWELFTLGGVPYPGLQIDENFYEKLKSGYRMGKPTHAPDEIYEIMKRCWKENPSERPDFRTLTKELGDLLKVEVKDYYVQLNEKYVKNNFPLTEANDVNMAEGGEARTETKDLNCDAASCAEGENINQMLTCVFDDSESKITSKMIPLSCLGLTKEDTQISLAGCSTDKVEEMCC